jgi:hypothetical protein
LAYAGLVRTELRYTLWGWSASVRIHYGFPRFPTPLDVAKCSAYSAELDTGGYWIPIGLGQLRTVHSEFVSVVSTAYPFSRGVQHLLLIGEASRHGGDVNEPTPSAGQSIGVELVTGLPGRGRNGRINYPYLGPNSFISPSLDKIDDLTASALVDALGGLAGSAPAAVGAELVVFSRQYLKLPVHPLASSKVIGTRVLRDVMVHQRRRVQWRRAFTPSY